MKSTLKYLAATALLTLTSSLVLTGCPETETCTTNEDCSGTAICNTDTNECVEQGVTCATSAECTEEGEVCIKSQDNSGEFVCGTTTDCGEVAVAADADGFCGGLVDGDICLPKADGTEGVECRVAADCGELSDGEAINTFCRNSEGTDAETTYTCDTSDATVPGACVADVTSEHYHVIIKDISTEACDEGAADTNGLDPGSDITFVELEGADGATLGWGKTVTYSPSTDDNDFQVETVLDGLAPDLITEGEQEDIDNLCPVGDTAGRFSETSVLTLGCTGSVIVDFPVDSASQPIYDGQSVVVGEYAPVCNQNTGGDLTGSTDLYEVYVCPPIEAGADAPSDLDCIGESAVKISTETSAGLKEYSVTGVKAAPAPADS